MATTGRPARRSISLELRLARRIRALARSRRSTANGVMVELIEPGLLAREQEKARFFELADRLTRAESEEKQARIKEELARLTFRLTPGGKALQRRGSHQSLTGQR